MVSPLYKKLNRRNEVSIFFVYSIFLFLSFIFLPFISHDFNGIIQNMIILSFSLGFFDDYEKNYFKVLFLALLMFFYSYISFNFTKKLNAHLYEEFFWILPSLYVIIFKDLTYSRTKNQIFEFCLIILLFTSITTIINLFIDPNSSRTLATNEILKFNFLNNTAGYPIVYSLIFFIPALMHKIKNESIFLKKAYYSFSIIILFFVIYKSQYTMAIFFTLLIIFLNLSKIKIKNILIFLFVILLISVIFHKFISFLLFKFSAILPKVISSKIYDIALLFKDGTIDRGVKARFETYSNSILIFKDNFLFGSRFAKTDFKSGLHSTFLDNLALNGILGCWILPLIIYINYKNIVNLNNDKNFISMNKYNMFIYIILGLLNPIIFAAISISVFFIPILINHKENNC